MRNQTLGAVGVALALLAAGSSFAAEEVKASHPWAGATAPGQKVAGAYLELSSTASATLVAVRSPVAGSVEIHSMSMEAGIMKMRRLEKLELPANRTVKLVPGGLHLMLIDLSKPLKPGDRVPLTLIVERADKTRSEVRLEAEVRPGVHGGHEKH